MELTKEEKDFIYYQLSARKEYFENDLKFWAEPVMNTTEVLRCARAIEMINSIQKKMLGV